MIRPRRIQDLEAMFKVRFGKGTGRDLLAAWKLASQVPLHLASFRKSPVLGQHAVATQ